MRLELVDGCESWGQDSYPDEMTVIDVCFVLLQ